MVVPISCYPPSTWRLIKSVYDRKSSASIQHLNYHNYNFSNNDDQETKKTTNNSSEMCKMWAQKPGSDTLATKRLKNRALDPGQNPGSVKQGYITHTKW